MVHHKFKEINAKEDQLLADLSDIENDFTMTIAICDHLANMRRGDFYDIKLIESLFYAAIVRYAHPFIYRDGTKILKAIVKRLPDKFRNDHYRFKDLRDSYVEGQKEKTIGENNKAVTPDMKEPETHNSEGASLQGHKPVTLDEVKRLKILCNEFLTQISSVIKDCHSK